MTAPLLYIWSGECMEPVRHYRRVAAEQFKIGRVYRLGEIEPRSMESHQHFFACINEAWLNLPEALAERWTTPDELRKWALTHTGLRTTREYVARSNAEAQRVAKFETGGDQYCRIEIDGKTVRVHIPRSQSLTSMTRREFQQSKTAVLDVLAQKLGISVETLEANAGQGSIVSASRIVHTCKFGATIDA